MRSTNPSLPDSDMKVSMSSLEIVDVGAYILHWIAT